MSDLAAMMHGVVEATRRQAEVECVFELAAALAEVGVASSVRLNASPLPRTARRSRKRLRGHQAAFVAWWSQRCTQAAGRHMQVAGEYAKVTSGGTE